MSNLPRKQEVDVIERLKKKTRYEGDCWIFTGKLTGRGYGNIWYRGIMVRVGRLICSLYHGGYLPDKSWTANHKPECKSPACWNPDHLYVGDMKSNVKDSIEAGTFHYGTENLFNNKHRRGSRKEY